MLGVQPADATDAALRPRAIVAGGTPADLRLYRGGTLVPQFLGARLQDDPERFRRASPAALVHAASAPMFLYHGTRDRLVPPPHPRALQQALHAANVPHELVWLAGRGHAGAYLFDGAAGRAAVDFLRRHLVPA